MTGKLLLSVPETADQLGVSRSMIFGLIRDGSLPSLKVGRRRMVPAAALPEFVRVQTTNADNAK
ncbi:excisionase family DNA-binding protein [Nocardia thailandica]|uniref:Excisionase family DNA-binding protein n=1 Tax=Nocardia thailandica TaxID=257275 RepID=A0ABW6PI83_9NOCA